MKIIKKNDNMLSEIREKYSYLFDDVEDAIITTDLEERIIGWNEGAERLLGWKVSEVIGKNISLIIPSSLRVERDLILHEILKNKTLKVLDTIRLDKQREKKKVSVMIIPLLEDNNNLIGFSEIIRDEKACMNKLLESEEKYRILVEHIQDGVFIVQDYKIRFANEAFAKIVGYTVEEITGMDIRELIAPEDRGMVEERYYQRLAGMDVPKQYQFRALHKNGSRVLVSIDVGTINYHGKLASIGTVKDITKLKESEESLRAIVEASLDAIIVINEDGRVVLFNPAAENLFLYSQDEVLNKPAEMLLHDIVVGCEDMGKRVQCRFKRKDGKIFDAEVAMAEGQTNGTRLIVMSIHDITERKQVEDALKESEERFRSIVEAAIDAIVLADSKGNIISCNKSTERIFLYDIKELVGKPLTILMPEKYREAHRKEFERLLTTDESHVIGKVVELEGLRKDGSEFPIELSLASWTTKNETFYSAIIRDISERKEAEKKLKASLKEKEVLLREIHHRVKNNMQIISSLLRLQSANIKQKEYLEIFRDSQNRIMSMALIHEKLYRSEDFTRINFNEYIKELVSELLHSYKASDRITLHVDTDSVALDVDSAVPCGLIINELVTNSIKYAFPNNKPGEISISLHRNNEGEVELVVSDNGIGIPDTVDIRKTDSLGLRLVTLLAENQLGGRIDLNTNNGTEFKIRFGGNKQ